MLENNPLKGGAWKKTIVPVGKAPEVLIINVDDIKVFIGCAGKILVIDLEQKIVVDSIVPGKYRTASLKFTLDGKYLLGTAGSEGNLLFIDVANKKIAKQLALGAGAIFIVPSGKPVMVSVTNENTIVEIDLFKMEVIRKLTGF